MFPSGIRASRSSVIVWQKDMITGTVHAVGLTGQGDGERMGYRKVVGFTP